MSPQRHSPPPHKSIYPNNVPTSADRPDKHTHADSLLLLSAEEETTSASVWVNPYVCEASALCSIRLKESLVIRTRPADRQTQSRYIRTAVKRLRSWLSSSVSSLDQRTDGGRRKWTSDGGGFFHMPLLNRWTHRLFIENKSDRGWGRPRPRLLLWSPTAWLGLAPRGGHR